VEKSLAANSKQGVTSDDMANQTTESEDLRRLLNDALKRIRKANEYCEFVMTDYDLKPQEKEICRMVKQYLSEID
jgi:hypothetical protein